MALFDSEGVQLSMGEGCDGDTIRTYLDGLEGLNVRLTTRDGASRDVRVVEICADLDVEPWNDLVVRAFDENAGMPVGPEIPIHWDDITHIHIY